MSVKLRFSSPSDSLAAVGRSRSFAGFSTLQVRKTSQSLRKNSVKSKMSLRSEKLYPSLRKGSVRPDPHPHQVKRIFEALRKGLNEYLEEHQSQLDFLAGQQKDIKRNSRLGYVYDLDKEIRLMERHVRKLEFHISKIEELYETYCIQWRLRIGTCNMKRAYSLSPATRASRESLLELSKNFQECTEDMCTIEGALEVHLGEFLIKMKGLVGYARLCPGDHYEVLIRLGRQRWRLKGKIETDDSQMWDEEKRIFIPNLCENFEIKVVEVRGLATIAVGVVSCDSADFFTTRPRIIIVDITELGTIKLQLEVTWNPFDNNKILSAPPGTSSKFSSSVRKVSLYHWTPPSTPSVRGKFYLQNELESNYPSLEKDLQRPHILSYLASSGFVRDRRSLGHSIDSLRNLLETGDEAAPSPPSSCGETLPYSSQELTPDGRPPSHQTLDILRETPNRYSAIRPARLEFSNKPNTEATEESGTAGVEERIGGERRSLSRQLDDLLHLLTTEEATRWKMKEMEQSVLTFRDRVLRSGGPELPSVDSLMVETALESFDFLDADFSADDMSLFGSVRAHSESGAVIPSVTFGCQSESEPAGRSAGHEDLDILLSLHLDICKSLLKKLMSPQTGRIVQQHLLEELSWQREVLEDLSIIFIQKAPEKASIQDIFPKTKKVRHLLKLWESCVRPGRPWFCSADVFLTQLKKMLVLKIKAKYPGQLEAVCRRALEQIFGFGGVMASGEIPQSVVSIFLFYGYLRRCHVWDLERHLTALTREVALIGDLQRPGRLKKMKKLKGKQISRLQPLPALLSLVAACQIDDNMKLRKAAAHFLSRAAVNKQFKQKAVLYYTELLSDPSVHVQRAACLALKHLKGAAGIDQIAALCQSEAEDVRITARDTILSFGQKGRHTFGKTDKICRDLQETLTLDGEVEITVF